jgi:hypothetical protein
MHHKVYGHTHRRVPDGIANPRADLPSSLTGIGLDANSVQDIRKVGKLDTHHRVRGCQEREHAQVVAGPMVGAYKPRVCLRLAVATVVNGGREGSVTPSPVVKRDPIEVLVKGTLRLFIDNTEDLANGGMPCEVGSTRPTARRKVPPYSCRS